MSYNIDTFKLKKVNLLIPKNFDLVAWDKENNNRLMGDIEIERDMKHWSLNWNGEGFQMKGDILPKGFLVTEVKCKGEGSGNDFHDALIPLFKELKGDLEASMVWEHGDSITKIIITKGKAKEEPIEI